MTAKNLAIERNDETHIEALDVIASEIFGAVAVPALDRGEEEPLDTLDIMLTNYIEHDTRFAVFINLEQTDNIDEFGEITLPSFNNVSEVDKKNPKVKRMMTVTSLFEKVIDKAQSNNDTEAMKTLGGLSHRFKDVAFPALMSGNSVPIGILEAMLNDYLESEKPLGICTCKKCKSKRLKSQKKCTEKETIH